MTKISRTFEGQYGREPTLDELARELGTEPAKIQDAYEAVFTPRSLDAPMADGEGATLGDVIEVSCLLQLLHGEVCCHGMVGCHVVSCQVWTVVGQ